MSYKGTRFNYSIQSKFESDLGKEIDIVGNAFQNAGWIEVEIIPEEGFPTDIVFEWQLDSYPVRPSIDLK